VEISLALHSCLTFHNVENNEVHSSYLFSPITAPVDPNDSFFASWSARASIDSFSTTPHLTSPTVTCAMGRPIDDDTPMGRRIIVFIGSRRPGRSLAGGCGQGARRCRAITSGTCCSVLCGDLNCQVCLEANERYCSKLLSANKKVSNEQKQCDERMHL